MPYAPQRDRQPHQLELESTPWPVAPLNLSLQSGYEPGIYELTWDNPAFQGLNAKFSVLGVNVYRSFDSEFGPYERISELPIGALFWRDRTDVMVVPNEQAPLIIDGFISNQHPNGRRYVVKVSAPIVKAGSQGVPAYEPSDVEVRVDGVPTRVLNVDGPSGEIEIDPKLYHQVDTQSYEERALPTEGSVVTVTYRCVRNLLKTDLMRRVFYRVTTVGARPCNNPCYEPSDLLETPLERAAFTSNHEVEKLDWIWTEAIRRNRWILDQGGERVKAFIRKTHGPACPCRQFEHHHQPLNDCDKCYGVGILGGYEGPYDILIAPDDAERRIAQKETGRSVEHTYEVWTGPSPLLSQRDFVVKINGERYSIGPVRFPSNRGNVLQQHFNIGHLDEKDIRYRVPVVPVPVGPNRVAPATPPLNPPPEIQTDKPNIPAERQLRGHTVTWKNHTY